MGIVLLGLFSETFRRASHCWVSFRLKPHCGAASTFQEVIRRLHGSFQFPTVLALHLYILARRQSYLIAFRAFRLTVQHLVNCSRKKQSAVVLKPLAHFRDLGKVWERAWPCQVFNGAAFGLAEG